MFQFDDTSLEQIVVHRVGNPADNEGVGFSNHTIQPSDAIGELLHKYFLSPFKTEQLYHLTGENEVAENPVYQSVKAIFESPNTNFMPESKKLAKHLYLNSHHPKVKGGEFYVTFFKDCIIDDEIADAIGIFKSENKETYLRVYQKDEQHLDIDYDDGININRLDKGCLIFNTEEEQGYVISIVDNLNKNKEAQFWKNDFLKVVDRPDRFYQTEKYLELYSNFAGQVSTNGEKEDKTKKIGLMNRAVSFFKEHDYFDEDQFKEEAIKSPELIKTYDDYKSRLEENLSVTTPKSFEIAPTAVKGAGKFVKKVLKLDKNFSLYVHGNGENIEKGWDDDRQLSYYKLFYKKEK